VNRHAKAPSAASTSGRGITCLAGLLAIASFVLVLFLAPSAQAGKVLGFGKLGTGTTGAGAGQLSGTQGVAVNTTGAGGATAGDVYVSEGTNNRVSVFSGAGTFIRMFGRNVVASGPDDNLNGEVQSLKIVATSGTFSLSFGAQTTGALPYNVPASGGVGPTASVQNALEALSTIGAGNVTVTGGPGDATGSTPHKVTFGGTLGGKNVAQITVTNAGGLGLAAGTQLKCTGAPASGFFGPNTLTYQWLANGESLGSANGAQTPTYTIQAADEGKVIQCRVRVVTPPGGGPLGATQVSLPTLAAEIVASPYPATPPPTTTQTSLAAPAVVGGGSLNAAGKKLTCAAGAWAGSPTFAYQWYANGVALSGNGADTSEYTVQAADVGAATLFQCAVTASNAGGNATLFSANRPTVAPLPEAGFGSPVPTASVPSPSAGTTIGESSGPEVCTSGVDVCQAGQSGSEVGSLAGAQGLAIDPANGNVFIASNTNKRVDVYSATGKYEGSFGWKVNASAPEEKLQLCTVATGCMAGSSGAGAGQLGTLTGEGGQGSQPAVSPTNGHLFVPEPGNRRVSEFSFTLNGSKEVTGVTFVKAFGGDVVPTINEKQTVTLTGASGGSFALSFKSQATGATAVGDLKAGSNEVSELEPSAGSTFVVGEELSGPGIPAGAKITAVTFDSLTLTAAATEDKTAAALSASLPFDASSTTVQGALEALSSLGKGNVSVTGAIGGPWTVEFKGALAGIDQPQMSGDASGLTGATPAVAIATTQTGANGASTALESCTEATTCKAGAGNGKNGTFLSSSPGSVAVDSVGAIYVTGQSQTNVQKLDPTATSAEEFASSRLAIPADSLSTVVLSSGPRSVSVDPSNDHILAVKKASTSTFKIFEFTRTGAFIDVVPPGEAGMSANGGAGNIGPQGLAVGTAGRAYLVRPNEASIPPGAILGSPPAPTATIDPASAIGQTSVTLNGIAKPAAAGIEGGFPTVASFEYSTDGISWKATDTIELGTGTGAGNPNSCPTENPSSCNVAQTLGGLVPGTTYLARLLVTNGTAATSSTITFTTADEAPTISAVNPNPVEETTASLGAKINPNGRSTTYRFEWGTDTSYGNRIPADFDAVAGSGSGPVSVSGELSGLEPGTAYHYRVIAQSSSGTTVSPDRELVTLNSEGLPAARRAELVSPPNKRPAGGAIKISLFSTSPYFQASGSGEAIGYPILNGLADSEAGGEAIYAATRTASGWTSAPVSPPSLITPPEEGSAGGVSATPSYVRAFNGDLSCGLVATPSPLTADTPTAAVESGMTFLYRWNAADGTYTLISNRIPSNPSSENVPYMVIGASADCSRVFFGSTYSFTAGASGVYEWEEGVLRDALLRPDGSTPPASGSDAATSITLQELALSKYRLAPSGRFFFFALSNAGADAGKRAIFVRKGPGPGEVIDASQTKTATAPAGAQYLAASPDGSKVFFAANYGLASNSTSTSTEDCAAAISDADKACDLYRYDVDSGQLTDVSADSNPKDSKGAVLQGVLDVSEDGSVVYFATRGQLIPGKGRTYAQNTIGSFASVYRWSEGEGVGYVGSLTKRQVANTQADRQGGAMVQNDGVTTAWNAQTTKDGDYLLFVSSDNLGGANPNGVSTAYLYSAATGQTECVSCDQNGIAQGAGAPRMITASPTAFNSFVPDSLSEDGRVFFTSEAALAPGAVDGQESEAALKSPIEDNLTENNLYEWHQGQVSLLATGKVTFRNMAGPGGRDAFITSYEQLAGQDTDFAPDLYDLRIGGGFAPPPPPPPACDPAADQCQGAPSAPAVAPSPSSVGTAGGNPPVPPEAKQPKAKKHKKRHHKKKRKAKQAKRAAKTNRGGAK